MSSQDRDGQGPSPDTEATSIGDMVDLVKDYARQETLGPLRGAGRWLAFGAAAALCIGMGLALVALGLLRLIQSVGDDVFDGAWSFVPYLIVLVLVGIATAVAVSRISKSTLGKEPS
jgi:hypothetical protein